MISIIIPIYNRAHLIEETLDSIKEQTYENWECIIVDDGSTDDTLMVVEQFIANDSRFKLYKRPKDLLKGPSSCRNYGVSLSSGAFIQFFDSDDVMHPDHLKLKREAIGDKDFVICQLKAFKGDFDRSLFSQAATDTIKTPDDVLEAFVTGEFPMMMVAPLWQANSIKPYLPIREDLHILEDHELYVRALAVQQDYIIINQPLIYYRVGSASSTNRFYKEVSYGLVSYFEAKRTALANIATPKVKLSILKMTLGFFRMALAERDLESATACLRFIKDNALCYSLALRLKFYRIVFFFIIFKRVKRGDTFFKPLFKL